MHSDVPPPPFSAVFSVYHPIPTPKTNAKEGQSTSSKEALDTVLMVSLGAGTQPFLTRAINFQEGPYPELSCAQCVIEISE